MSSFRSQLDRFAQRSPKPGIDMQAALSGAAEAVQRQLDGAWPVNAGRYNATPGPQVHPVRARQPAVPGPRPETQSRPPTGQIDLLQREVQLVRNQLAKAMDRLGDGKASGPGDSRAAPAAPLPEPPAARAELAGMASELTKVREQGAATTSILEQIAGELIALRQSFEALNQQPQSQSVDASGLSHTITSGYSDLAARLEDTMGQLFAVRDTSPAADNQRGQIGALADHVSAIRDAIDTLPVRFPIAAVHGQLDHLTGSIEKLVGQGNGSLANCFAELNERLDEVTRALVTLSIGTGGNDMLDRIEARMASLAKTVDLMAVDVRQAAQNPPGASEAFADEIRAALIAIEGHLANRREPATGSPELLQSIEAQMHQLSQKLDNVPAMQETAAQIAGDGNGVLERLEAIAARLDAPPRETAAASGHSRAIEQQLAELNRRLERALADRAPPQGAAAIPQELTEILHEIAARLETATPDGRPALSEPGQMAHLSGQLDHLAAQIETMKANAFDFSPISARLDSIEQQVALSRDLAIDVASHAAQHAVSLAGNAAADPGPIGVLSQDLRNLEAATQTLTQRNIETIDALRGTLAAMTARLGEIEEKIPDAADYADQTLHDIGEAFDHMNGVRRNDPELEPELRPVGDAPGLDTDALPDPAQDARPASGPETGPEIRIEAQSEPEIDDVPLEPGSGAPDLAALVRRASEKRLSGAQGAAPVSASDVIAAARRAAQAAAQEAAAIRRGQTTEPERKKSSFSLSSIVGRLGNRRKMTATVSAIALLAAIAIPAWWLLAPSRQTAEAPSIGQTEEAAAKSASEPAPDEQANSAAAVELQSAAAANGREALQADGADEKIGGEAQSEPARQQTNDLANVQAGGQTGDPAGQSGSSVAENANSVDTNEAGASRALAGKAITQAPMPPEEAGNIVIRQAAASGNAAALFEIARRYTDGDIVERDLAEAAKWYGHAAEAGYAPAQYRLGNFHEKGHGVSVDLEKAADWYGKAAEQGNALAMHNLAVLLTSGLLGGKPDMKAAIGWFTKAAELGVKDSQVNLGILYTRGMGVNENLVEAYKWFAVAARGGDSDAATKRDTLANAMRPDQLAEARGIAELWKPAALDPAANQAQTNPEWLAMPARAADLSVKETIARAQELLAKLGFEPGPADGVIGAKTRDAVKAFQKRAGLKVNGEIDEALIAALVKDAA